MPRPMLLVLLLTGLIGCDRGEPSVPTPSRSVTVLIAASTRDAMQEAGDLFATRSGAPVKLVPGPSNGLAQQAIAGAPADVLLSANVRWMDAVQEQGLVARRVTLLRNALVLIVPRANDAGVNAAADLLGERVKHVALAGENVPAGLYAQQALTALGLYEALQERGVIVRGQDVRATLAYVERGEADAGVVYATDAAIAAGVRVAQTFDPASHDAIDYPLALLKAGESNSTAVEFFEFLQSPEAREVFKRHGFAADE